MMMSSQNQSGRGYVSMCRHDPETAAIRQSNRSTVRFTVTVPKLVFSLLCTLLLGGAGCTRESEGDPDALLEQTAKTGYVRRELPVEQNAYPLWTNAIALAKLPRGNDDLRDAFNAAASYKTNLAEFAFSSRRAVKGRPYDGCLRSNMTTVADCPLLAEWMDSKAVVYSQIDAGLSMGQLQFPQMTYSNIMDNVDLSGFVALSQMKKIEGRRYAENRDLPHALQAFSDLVKMGEMLQDGDAPLLAFGLGDGILSEGLKGFKWLGHRLESDSGALREILKKIPVPERFDPHLTQTCRVESHLLSYQALEALAKGVASDPKSIPIRFSKVFNAKDSARLASALLARVAANAVRGWPERDETILADLKNNLNVEGLPERIKEDFGREFSIASMVDRSGNKNTETKRIWKALEKAGRQQSNIFGILILESTIQCADTLHKSSVRRRSSMNMTRTFLALRIVRNETGAYPEALGAVVAKGILSEVPEDFFSNRPLLYSPERQIIWSVGPDGVDDGGDKKKDIVIDLP